MHRGVSISHGGWRFRTCCSYLYHVVEVMAFRAGATLVGADVPCVPHVRWWILLSSDVQIPLVFFVVFSMELSGLYAGLLGLRCDADFVSPLGLSRTLFASYVLLDFLLVSGLSFVYGVWSVPIITHLIVLAGYLLVY